MDNKLQEILIRAKKDVFGGNLGENLTTFKGDGLDFREIKEYEIGDDIRKINWNATAKTSKTQVNIFNIDKQLNIILVFLVNGSIHFGSYRFKQEVASEILAHLSYSTIKNNNILSSLFFSNKEEHFVEPSSNESSIYTISKEALNIDCLEKNVSYNEFCSFINRTVKEKSLIFIVGDFYGDIDLSSISYQHEVYALIVRDRFEEYPYIHGEYDFVSPIDFSSSGISMNKNIASKYKQLIKENDDKFYSHCFANQIVVDKIYTDEDIYLRLSEILKNG